MRLRFIVKKYIALANGSLRRLSAKKSLLNSCRILLYHSIGENEPCDYMRLKVKPDEFKRQMEFLKNNGYKICSIGELITLMDKDLQIPEKSVVISFDDGYKDNATSAAPILHWLGFPAVFFITTDYIDGPIGNDSDFYWEEWEFMNWDDVKKLDSLGFEIGCHSKRHIPLNILNNSRLLEDEIKTAKQNIENKIGKRVDYFSYPHGGFDRNVQDVLKSLTFKIACRSRAGLNTHQTNRLELKRTEITGFDDLRVFKMKLEGFYDIF